MDEKPKWHIDPEASAATPGSSIAPSARSSPRPKKENTPPTWKRIQWTTYIDPTILQALKKLAEERSNESRRRVTPADLLDEALLAYLKRHGVPQ